jgi:ankyrin repeat protein
MGVNQNQTNSDFITAVYRGDIGKAELMLIHGADVHTGEDKALRVATQQGNMGMVKMLLGRGANVRAKKDNALRKAARYDRTGIASLLLARGADVHAKEDRALCLAAEGGNTNTVSLLLDHGADIHVKNDKPLRMAVYYAHPQTAKLLLDRGASIQAVEDKSFRSELSNMNTRLVYIIFNTRINEDFSAYDQRWDMEVSEPTRESILHLVENDVPDIHKNGDSAMKWGGQALSDDRIGRIDIIDPLLLSYGLSISVLGKMTACEKRAGLSYEQI